MKTIILLLMLMMCGCEAYLSEASVNNANKLCEPNGGIRTITIGMGCATYRCGTGVMYRHCGVR
jgi:hypothetical protein